VNNNTKYKAYISYSHRDDKWASWLHRVLESYRVPRKLVGTQTNVGKVPSRVNPVFRDRDDLSSAANLGGIVAEALHNSENLIVVCSPNAASSHWVNEEIRQFARLGRADRIFCVIIDGDPAGGGTASACFPEALAEVGMQEPLAADVRQWADGKHLSKLKIVSGMLGLPLDQLRRRDLQKRQRLWAFTAVLVVAIAIMMISAITSQITAQQRRDSGESLVAYKLGELRTLLNVKDDPENLTRLQQWNPQDLEKLISQAGTDKNALFDTAMQLREDGNTLYSNGAFTDALEKFQRSWALLAEYYRHDRSNQTAFFELGQAEFYIGQIFFDQGDLDNAENAFISYAEISRRLILLQPENADWVLEMAFALNNLGILHAKSAHYTPERHLQLMQSALEYNQIALVLDPTNEFYQSELGQSHAFLADAQMGVCDLEGAYQSRKRNVQLEFDILAKDNESTSKKIRLAWALSGLSTVESNLQRITEAIDDLEEAVRLLESALEAEPENKRLIRDLLYRKSLLVMLKNNKGDTETASLEMNALDKQWKSFFRDGISDASFALTEYVSFLSGSAHLAKIEADIEKAGQLLDESMALLSTELNDVQGNRLAESMLVSIAFQYWELKNALPPDSVLTLLPDLGRNVGRIQSCAGVDAQVKLAIMFDDFVSAQESTDYLIEKGYQRASFVRICREYALCEGQ